MQRELESGRYASSPGWQILRNSRSINHGRVVLGYKHQGEVSESINRLASKSNRPLQRLFSFTHNKFSYILNSSLWFVEHCNCDIHRFSLLGIIITFMGGK
jgi:hypothetical protein